MMLEEEKDSIFVHCIQKMLLYTKILLCWFVVMLQSDYTKLEVVNARLEKQLSDILEQTSKTSNKINFLGKENTQLQRELEKALV